MTKNCRANYLNNAQFIGFFKYIPSNTKLKNCLLLEKIRIIEATYH